VAFDSSADRGSSAPRSLPKGSTGKRCPRTLALARVNTSTGEVFAPRCEAWRCPVCSLHLEARIRARIEWGALAAVALCQPLQLLLLTPWPTSPAWQPSDLFGAWSRVLRSLRYQSPPFEFAAVAQTDPDAKDPERLHLHVLIAGARVEEKRLRKLAVRAGLGYIVDEEKVTPSERDAMRVALYMSRRLAIDGQRLGGLVPRLRFESHSRGWPRRTEGRPMSEARQRLRAAQTRRRRRMEVAQQDRRADLVLAVAAEHGLARVDVTETPATVRRCFAKLLGAMATHPAEAGVTEAAAEHVRAVAGQAFVSEGMTALDVATWHPADVRDELAAHFPAWSPDVVRIATALEPDLAEIWERNRRAAPESAQLAGYPAWPNLDLQDPEPSEGGDL